jgi:hypothetical protein
MRVKFLTHSNDPSADTRESFQRHLHSIKFACDDVEQTKSQAHSSVEIYCDEAVEASRGVDDASEPEQVSTTTSDVTPNSSVINEAKEDSVIEADGSIEAPPTRDVLAERRARVAAKLAAEANEEALRRAQQDRKEKITSHYKSLDASLKLLRERLAELSVTAEDDETDVVSLTDSQIEDEGEEISNITASETPVTNHLNESEASHEGQSPSTHKPVSRLKGIGFEFMSQEDHAARSAVRQSIRSLTRNLRVDQRIGLLDDLFRWTLRRHKVGHTPNPNPSSNLSG